MTRIKICCISSRAEADLAVRCGADALGLVSEMPSGPGVISEELIADIAAHVPPGVSTFLLTSKQDVASIVEQQRRLRTDTLQLVDDLTAGSYAELRDALPGVHIVQVLHVGGKETITQAETVAPQVDAILLDSGNPNARIKELGGTGRTHNWEISREIVRRSETPVFLAGGLNADNVVEAIRRSAGPYGVDICSGVRTDGKLDEIKLAAFVASVRAA